MNKSSPIKQILILVIFGILIIFSGYTIYSTKRVNDQTQEPVDFNQTTDQNDDLQNETIVTLWEIEPKILLDKHTPDAWWLEGHMDGEPTPDVLSPSIRLRRALERNESVVVENFGQIYVNDYNNTVFVVTKSLDANVTDAFLDIMNPDPSVSVIFRQGYASWIELEEWVEAIRSEIENIEASGVEWSFFGKSENATIIIGIINISMDDVEIILELLDGKVPPGILVFELGSKASAIPPPSRPTVMRIGVVTPTQADIPKYEFLLKLAEEDMLNYLTKSNIDVSIEYYIDSSNEQGLIALDLIKRFKSMDVNFVIFGGSTSQLELIDAYVNDNDILVINTASTNPSEALQARDNVFRLCPDSLMNSKTVAKVSLDYGINRMILLENGNTWAKYIGDQFMQDFSGEVLARIKYQSNSDDYSDILSEAESLLETALANSPTNDIGVFWVEQSSDCHLIESLETFPLLSNITWFSTEPISNSDIILRIEPSIASRIKLISPKLMTAWNNDTYRISDAYQSRFNDSFDFYDAVIYDSYMSVWLSMIERNSDNAYWVREVFPQVAGDYEGLTGLCGLDNYGDRINYLVEFYAITDSINPRWSPIGYYHAPEDFIYDTIFPHETLSIWDMEPKILLNQPSSILWWLKGYENASHIVSKIWKDEAMRLTNALENEDPNVVENYCMTYVNDFNNTIFIVTKSLEQDVLNEFLNIMNPDPNVTIIFRKGYASWIEVDNWIDIIMEEREDIEAQGVRFSLIGRSENATILMWVIDIELEKVQVILNEIEGKVPPGILCFWPGGEGSLD